MSNIDEKKYTTQILCSATGKNDWTEIDDNNTTVGTMQSFGIKFIKFSCQTLLQNEPDINPSETGQPINALDILMKSHRCFAKRKCPASLFKWLGNIQVLLLLFQSEPEELDRCQEKEHELVRADRLKRALTKLKGIEPNLPTNVSDSDADGTESDIRSDSSISGERLSNTTVVSSDQETGEIVSETHISTSENIGHSPISVSIKNDNGVRKSMSFAEQQIGTKIQTRKKIDINKSGYRQTTSVRPNTQTDDFK
ncbi:unnamed protein product [Mytilus edulis]|uniref:Uncharacterized protein n=1 Tax=Mytilus edulis TaxID=6550 RepID=A0A8S3TJT5_MYTED|nr:unnamed protein product [Mytilus edulis]